MTLSNVLVTNLYDIAQRIIEHFEERDEGNYAAIIDSTGKPSDWSYFYQKGFKKELPDVHGREMLVFKQFKSPETSRMQNKTTFDAFVTGLIQKHDF